jgi:hypothetical protein
MIDGILDINGGGACLNRCLFCYAHAWEVATWDKVVAEADKLIALGVSSVHIEGQDAGQWDRLIDIIYYLKEHGINRVALGTHGRTLKDRNLVQQLKDTGVIENINIPLYGSNEKIHNGVVQSRWGSPGNAFQDSTEAIYNCAQAGLPVFGHIGLTQSNKNDIINIFDLYMALTNDKVESIDITPIFVLIPSKLFTRKWYLPTKDMGPYLRKAWEGRPKGPRIQIHQIPYCVYGEYTDAIDSRVLYAPWESEAGRKTSHSISRINTPTEADPAIAGYRKKSYFDECEKCALRAQCIGISTHELKLFGSKGLKAFPKE